MDWLLNTFGWNPRKIAEDALVGAVKKKPWYAQINGALETGKNVIGDLFTSVLDWVSNFIFDITGLDKGESKILGDLKAEFEAKSTDANLTEQEREVYKTMSETAGASQKRGMDRVADWFKGSFGQRNAQEKLESTAEEVAKSVFEKEYTRVATALIKKASPAKAKELLDYVNYEQIFNGGSENGRARFKHFAELFPEIHAEALASAAHYSGMSMDVSALNEKGDTIEGAKLWTLTGFGLYEAVTSGVTEIPLSGATPAGSTAAIASDTARLVHYGTARDAFAKTGSVFGGLKETARMQLTVDTAATITDTTAEGATDMRITAAELDKINQLTAPQKAELAAVIGLAANSGKVIADIDIDQTTGEYAVYAHPAGDPTAAKATKITL